MRNLLIVLSLSVWFFPALSQHNTKKYIKRNRKAPTIHYGDSSIYSRGLYIDSTIMLIGNSDGSIYMMKPTWDKSRLLFKLNNFTETRDIEKSGDYFIGIQSGATGKVVRIHKGGGLKIIRYPAWDSLFIDGIDFLGTRGFMMGDPVDSVFSLFHTNDNGENWETCEGKIKAFKGEAGFAASGTNVQVLNDSTYVFVSGGMKSRFMKSTDNGKSWNIVELPYYPGESTGPYSMCFANDSIGVLVGGDYTDPDIHLNTTFYTYDGGESWFNAPNPTRGYRSCVYHVNGVFYACGRNGIDFSTNNGMDWTPFADGAYFSMGSDGKKLYATTRYGAYTIFDLIEND